MARLYEHTMEFGGIMAPTSPAPVDNRSVVSSKEDLINPETWDGKAYEGMNVSIPSIKEVYQLTDISKLTEADYSGWTLMGGSGLTESLTEEEIDEVTK